MIGARRRRGNQHRAWFIMPPMGSGEELIPRPTEETSGDRDTEPFCRVIVHNDDFTPMDFVIHILLSVFQVPNPNATAITYSAHVNGIAYVQTLPRPEAQRRISTAHFASRLSGHPLEFSMECQ
jgi:ATP-dependent Clp protease adaptor protein ClpS